MTRNCLFVVYLTHALCIDSITLWAAFCLLHIWYYAYLFATSSAAVPHYVIADVAVGLNDQMTYLFRIKISSVKRDQHSTRARWPSAAVSNDRDVTWLRHRLYNPRITEAMTQFPWLFLTSSYRYWVRYINLLYVSCQSEVLLIGHVTGIRSDQCEYKANVSSTLDNDKSPSPAVAA